MKSKPRNPIICFKKGRNLSCAGAIALLLETGDCEAAIQWGLAWMDANAFDPCVPDVASLIATAYCDRAGMLVETSLENSLEAYTTLQTAEGVVWKYNTGRELLGEISASRKVSSRAVTFKCMSDDSSFCCQQKG